MVSHDCGLDFRLRNIPSTALGRSRRFPQRGKSGIKVLADKLLFETGIERLTFMWYGASEEMMSKEEKSRKTMD